MKNLEILFVLAAAILAALSAYRWDKISIVGKITFVIVILASLLIAFNTYKQNKKDALVEKVNSKVGEINTDGASHPTFMIGHSDDGARLDKGYGNGLNYMASPLETISLINISFKNDRLLLYVVIRDFDGEPIAVIDDSEWTVFDNDYEYNNDDYSFEMVTKGDRNVYFQVFFKDGIIYLSGYFLCYTGKGVVLYYSNDTKMSGIRIYGESSKKEEIVRPSELKIPRIFKYPREKYFGKKL